MAFFWEVELFAGFSRLGVVDDCDWDWDWEEVEATETELEETDDEEEGTEWDEPESFVSPEIRWTWVSFKRS